MKFFLGIFFGFFAIEKNRFSLACRVGCDSDYHLVDGKCMKISDHRGTNLLKNWDDAKKICENEGAKLAVITSQAQDDFLTQYSENVPVWIGIKLAGSGNWMDVDNTQRTGVRVTQQFSFLFFFDAISGATFVILVILGA